MSKPYTHSYFVRGKIFDNTDQIMNGRNKAVHYCRVNKIDESEIYEVANDSELAYLNLLLDRKKKGEITHIDSHKIVPLLLGFVNANGDGIPPLEFELSFYYIDIRGKPHFVVIIDNLYELTTALINVKKLFDWLNQEESIYKKYLEIYYLDDNNLFREWKIGDKELAKTTMKKAKTEKKSKLKEIRDRQRFDRLLGLREKGIITDNQKQELYRLEKVFGGQK